MTASTGAKRAARARILAAMPGTQAEIRAAAAVSQATASRWCTHLLDCAECHIGGWLPNPSPTGGPPMAIYHAGPGANVACPFKPLTQRERDRRSRRARRRSGAWEDVKARERARYWADKAPARDPLTAALFGAGPVTAQ